MKIFYIMGKSASGKDSVFKELMKKGSDIFEPIIPYTTRPMRKGEVNGKDYNFVSNEEFDEMLKDNMIIEYRSYKVANKDTWTYLTPKLKDVGAGKVYLGIGTLESYKSMKEYYGDDMIPIYIEVDDETRLKRAIDRESTQNNPNYKEVCRRFISDEEDFSEEKLKEANIMIRFWNQNLNRCVEYTKGYIYGFILAHENI